MDHLGHFFLKCNNKYTCDLHALTANEIVQLIILYFLNYNYINVVCAEMFYIYCVCVIIKANKDDDHHYYYYDESKRHSLQAVELSQWIQTAVQIVSKPPALSIGGPIYRFGASRPCEPAGRLAMLLIKADYVETNPGPTTSHKRVWICDIYYKQIHVRKQISIRCNMIEH